MKSFLKFLFFVLLLALGISLIYVWQARQPGQPQARVEKFTPAEVPSVVSITTTKTVERRQPIDPLELFFGRRFGRDGEAEQKVTSLGSGVIVSKEGHIVTNNHVVNGTDDVTVQLSDGREAK